jgi:NACalpha-BTF3-like transcription factor
MDREYLFCGNEIRLVLEAQKRQLISEIDSQAAKYLLNISEDDYAKHLLEKHSISIPILHSDKKNIHNLGDSSIDVSGRFDYAVDREEGPVYVKGTSVTVAIPFEGDPELFGLKLPSTYFSYPRGSIINKEIHLTYSRLRQDQGNLKAEIDNDIKRIEQCVRELNGIIEQHNGSLLQLIKETMAKRKTKLLADLQLAESLGIPLKKREDVADQVAVPLVRKKIIIEKPRVAEQSYIPDPTMLSEDYESILSMIKNLSLVIERNYQTFATMTEPDIRNIILVLLNAIYEGTATGETFNGAGKTDILLRHEGQNLFIAECKFWQGKKEFVDAISQLLGYITWRDTKTALIIFNRNKDLTSVLQRIQESIREHKCYKQEIGASGTTFFRYKFCHPNDTNKDFFLTVLVFEVPEK